MVPSFQINISLSIRKDIARHLTRCSHARTNDVDFRQLLVIYVSSPPTGILETEFNSFDKTFSAPKRTRAHLLENLGPSPPDM